MEHQTIDDNEEVYRSAEEDTKSTSTACSCKIKVSAITSKERELRRRRGKGMIYFNETTCEEAESTESNSFGETQREDQLNDDNTNGTEPNACVKTQNKDETLNDKSSEMDSDDEMTRPAFTVERSASRDKTEIHREKDGASNSMVLVDLTNL